MIFLLFALTAANELVLAYNDDGTAALTSELRLVRGKESKRFDVSTACKARVLELKEAVRSAKFTGVEISVKGCGRKAHDTIVRTLKRHAEIAAAAEHDVGDEKIVRAGGAQIAIPPGARRYAVSPSQRLVLFFARQAGGAVLIGAAAIDEGARATFFAIE